MATDGVAVGSEFDSWHEPLPAPEVVPVQAQPPPLVLYAQPVVVYPTPEELGVCPTCGGYFDVERGGPMVCHCGEDEEFAGCHDCGGYLGCYCYEDEGPEHDDADPEDDDPGECPCCGGPNDPVELVFPFCSNRCLKDHGFDQ